MAMDWGMIGTVVSIIAFLAPIWYTAALKGIDFFRKRHRHAIRLKWSDIRANTYGKVHHCTTDAIPQTAACCAQSQVQPHHKQEACWGADTSIAGVFNRSWKLAKDKPAYVPVPDCVPTGTELLCTDVRTVLAFAMMTTRPGACLFWREKMGGRLVAEPTRIEFWTWREIKMCHIQGKMQLFRKDLKKHELERLLDGYPPWYRDSFKTWTGLTLQFPVMSMDDVPRGGWIAAVGMMALSNSQTPLPLYRCAAEPNEPEFRSNGEVFRRAIKRCLDHITRNIHPHFPNDVNVKAAMTMLAYLYTEKTGSGMPRPGEFIETHTESETFPKLNASQCKFLMENFNTYKPLSDVEVDKFRAILLPAMAAVVQGANEVVEYLKSVGVYLKLPDGWSDFDGEVYLNDCTTQLPYT